MTNKEYKEYELCVKRFFKREGLQNLSIKQDCDEPYFSKRPCDCCGEMLAGDRYDANGWSKRDNVIKEYVVCQNCIYYAEYGRLDDKTMMEIK